jgi:hypothetical protein
MADPIEALIERAKEADTGAKKYIRAKIRKANPHLRDVDSKHYELVSLVEAEWKEKLAER